MVILNEYELHKLAVNSYIEFNETAENKYSALVAMRILPPREGYSDREYADIIKKTLNKKLDKKYLIPVDSLSILQHNVLQHVEVSLPKPDENDEILWEISEKSGKKINGKVKIAESLLVKDIEGGFMVREINGKTYERRSILIPQEKLDGLDYGYHTLKLKLPGIKEEIVSQIAYAPEKCYQPLDLSKEKVRGTSVAIPSIRSAENIGMGNYSDLAQLGHICAGNGLDIIGTLPIHSMNHNMAEAASPYSPDSRTFFNFGYLDITAVPEFVNDKNIQEIYDSDEFEKARRKNQDNWSIDYTTSYELLLPVLEACYESFKRNASPERKSEFADFKHEKGEDLYNYALYKSLSSHFANQNPPLSSWKEWPEEFQQPDTPQVKKFAGKNKDSIEYFSYLQWETIRQIKNVQETCKNSGMKIGLYNDLAVGETPNGFGAWANGKDYLDGTIGIPPDMCSVEGQNWGIIVYNPNSLDDKGYKPFISMLESNMLGGMLRIDCPLAGFVKSNFIPEGKTPKESISIYMPTDKLLALTALTSNLTKTPIVFEDLGAIPEDFRAKIQEMDGITYKVLQYERCSTRDFPASSLVVTSTHDSETLDIWWKGASAYMLANRNCLPQEYVGDFLKGAWEARKHMANLLLAEKCIDEINPEINHYTPKGYFKAVAKLIGDGEHCTSAYGIMPMTDILGIPLLRENLPGTPELHTSKSPNARSSYGGEGINLPNANWRTKLSLYLNEIAINPRFKEVTSALSSQKKEETAYKRPGRNEIPRRDPQRLTNLYIAYAKAEEELISKGNEPRFTGDAAYGIWQARFSEKRKNNLMHKAKQQADEKADRIAAIQKAREEYRKSISKKQMQHIDIRSK